MDARRQGEVGWTFLDVAASDVMVGGEREETDCLCLLPVHVLLGLGDVARDIKQ